MTVYGIAQASKDRFSTGVSRDSEYAPTRRNTSTTTQRSKLAPNTTASIPATRLKRGLLPTLT